ncbi:MAG: 3'-5' exonuclease, partial [Actinomycetia bacterium]|nr:3'-5' exonuclease [Actinomycetes bacterium]
MPAAELNALLIPGTDADIIANYASLSQRAQEARWGFEDDVVILDTETTGLSLQRDAIIEVAAARLRGPEIVARYTTFVNPQRPISEQITELTGISDADVAEAP